MAWMITITPDPNFVDGDITYAPITLSNNELILEHIQEPFRHGYIFKGWNTDKAGNGTKITSTMVASDLESVEVWGDSGAAYIFAQWEKEWESFRYPFRMYGRIIQTYNYEVSYPDVLPIAGDSSAAGGGGASTPPMETVTTITVGNEYYPTLEEAQANADARNGVIKKLSHPFDWADGIEVEDVPETYTAALEVFRLGQEKWERKKAFDAAKDTEKLRADLDYVMLMGGLS